MVRKYHALEDCLLPDDQTFQELSYLSEDEEDYRPSFTLDGDMSDLSPEKESLWMEHASEHFVTV